jgi:hypothetical protein
MNSQVPRGLPNINLCTMPSHNNAPSTENIFYASLKCMQIWIAFEVGFFIDKAAPLGIFLECMQILIACEVWDFFDKSLSVY